MGSSGTGQRPGFLRRGPRNLRRLSSTDSRSADDNRTKRLEPSSQQAVGVGGGWAARLEGGNVTSWRGCDLPDRQNGWLSLLRSPRPPRKSPSSRLTVGSSWNRTCNHRQQSSHQLAAEPENPTTRLRCSVSPMLSNHRISGTGTRIGTFTDAQAPHRTCRTPGCGLPQSGA